MPTSPHYFLIAAGPAAPAPPSDGFGSLQALAGGPPSHHPRLMMELIR